MPVQEFECQIARSQIGRYLSGEGLSSEGLRQLGAHVAECNECKGFLDHRKAALQGMLGEAPMPQQEVRAVVETDPKNALIAQLRAKAMEDAPAPTPVAVAPEVAVPAAAKVKPLVTKPVMLCAGLAVVLVAMTYISRNPTSLLGPKASTQLVADNSKTTTAPEVEPAAKSKPVVEPKKDTAAPKKDIVTTPKATEKPAPSTEDTRPTDRTDATTPTNTDSNEAVHLTTGATKSPLSVDDTAAAEQAEATGATPAVTPKKTPAPAIKHVAKPAVRVKARSTRWVRRGKGHRRYYGFRHLKPGTSAIHVYAN